MADDIDPDFGFGEDFADIDDADADADEDDDADPADPDACGAAVVLCLSVVTMRTRMAFFDDVNAAMAAAARQPCGIDGCGGRHTVGYRDQAGHLRIVGAQASDAAEDAAALRAELHALHLARRRQWKRNKVLRRQADAQPPGTQEGPTS
jgi:hypothetical protein